MMIYKDLIVKKQIEVLKAKMVLVRVYISFFFQEERKNNVT